MEGDSDVFNSELLPEPWKVRLEEQYAEKQRHYHTANHVSRMLKLLEKYRKHVQDEAAIRLAIYFHDVIYDPTAKDGKNEKESKDLFESYALSMGLESSQIAQVSRMILATIQHRIPEGAEGDSDLRMFLDFDLEILASSEEDYNEYTKNVRLEYSHLSDEEWRVARAAVMKRFLERGQFYFSEIGKKWEEQARLNVSREVSSLIEGEGHQ